MPWHEGAGPNILVRRILEKLAGSALELLRFDSESCSLSEEPLVRRCPTPFFASILVGLQIRSWVDLGLGVPPSLCVCATGEDCARRGPTRRSARRRGAPLLKFPEIVDWCYMIQL